MAWICVFLVLAVLAVFGQTAHFQFLGYDDSSYVFDNARVTAGLSLRNVAWALTHVECSLYHPLTIISLMLDYQLHGLNAGAFHLTNVLIHAATAILLFLILRTMTGALWPSAFVAAVFAIHPLRAESVAWVAERKDVLAAFFFMLAIGAYVRFVRKPDSAGRYLMVALFFLLALLSKPTAVTLPFVLLLLDYWPLGRMKGMQNAKCKMQNAKCAEQGVPSLPFWGLVKEKIPLAAMAAVLCVVTYFAAGNAVVSVESVSLPARIGNVLVSYLVYLRQMVWPAGLAVFYPYPENSYPPWEIALAFLLLAGISGGFLACWRRCPWLLAGWLWYLGMLVPVIGIVKIGAFAHADRYTYLPQIGLYVLLTWAVADWGARWKLGRAWLGGLMIGAMGALMVCAGIQTSYWKDDETLWRRALACASGNYIACNNLGNVLVKQGKLEEAIAHFQKALEILPGYPEARSNLAKARYNLGNALFKQGRLEEALAQYRASLAIEPANAEALNNLGNALATKGDDDAAIAQYQKALALQPGYSDALFDLGHVLLKQGKLDEALLQFHKLVEIKPHDAETQNDLGKALLQKGDFDGAMACFDQAAALTSDPVANWCKLGDGFLQKENWEVAISCYQRALKINPRHADACASLGLAFFKKGEAREAVDSWRRALAIYPDQVSVLNNLAWLLATTTDTSLRDGPKAVALAKQASQLSGAGNPVILHTLAVAYAAEGSYGLAADTARRALELAVEQKKDALAATLQKEITLYEANTPPRPAVQ